MIAKYSFCFKRSTFF